MQFLKNKRLMTPLINVFVRSSSIIARFFLTFFIARYIDLEASGEYGLTIGAVGLAPAIVGFGLNYYVSREVVGLDRAEALRLMANRYVVTFSALAVASLLAGIGTAIADLPVSFLTILCVVIVWLETFALDTHLPLIGMEMAFEANVLLFIRTACWIFPVLVVEYVFPQFRSLSLIMAAWIISHFLAIYVLSRFMKDWPLSVLGTTRFRVAWLMSRIRRSWMIYLSDLGLAGSTYVDRYIVIFFLGIAATGIFSFYWALANAVQSLVQTAVVQLALPGLVKSHRLGNSAEWNAQLKREAIKACVTAVTLAVLIYFTAHLLLMVMNAQNLSGYDTLFISLLASVVMRVASDILNIALTSRHLDKYYAIVNISGIFVSSVVSMLFISRLGLTGAGLGALVGNTILVLMRFAVVWRAKEV